MLFLSRHSLGEGGCALCGKMISWFPRFYRICQGTRETLKYMVKFSQTRRKPVECCRSVAGLLPILLPILLPLKSLIINDVVDVADVADFPDLHINLKPAKKPFSFRKWLADNMLRLFTDIYR